MSRGYDESEYERAVEAIEAWDGEFSVSGVWRFHRDNGDYWGPRQFNVLKRVVADLAAHDLIYCVRRTPNGKCRRWAKR